ncbi:MAG: hypothetical protein ACOC2W_03770 [bacterium]
MIKMNLYRKYNIIDLSFNDKFSPTCIYTVDLFAVDRYELSGYNDILNRMSNEQKQFEFNKMELFLEFIENECFVMKGKIK